MLSKWILIMSDTRSSPCGWLLASLVALLSVSAEADNRKARAWREAQLSLLHSTEFSSPYYWAAFTLSGQSD